MMVPHCRMLRWQPPRWRKLPRGCGRAWHSIEGIRSRTTPSETRLLPALSQHRSQQRPWPATMRPLGRGIQRRCDSIPEIQTPLLALQRYRQCPFCPCQCDLVITLVMYMQHSRPLSAPSLDVLLDTYQYCPVWELSLTEHLVCQSSDNLHMTYLQQRQYQYYVKLLCPGMLI